MSQTNTRGESEQRLRVLDAFRAIAIFAVMAHHYLSRYAPPDRSSSLYGYVHQYPQSLDLGAMGVQFFFIISGFVIFMTLQRCRHLLEFWSRRLARLYPAYVVGLILTFVIVNTLGPAEFHSTIKDALIGLTFMTSFASGTRFVEPAYWSLVVEMQFYFCIGILYTFFRPRFELAWTLYMGAGMLLWIAGESTQWHVLGSVSRQVFLASNTPYFTAGIIFYLLYRGTRRGVWMMSIAALAEYVLATPSFNISQHIATAAMLVAFTLFVAGRLEWLATDVAVFVGGISYSLYLVHQYIGVSLIPLFTRGGLGLPDLAAVSAVTLICGVLAYEMTRWVEIPAKRILLRLTGRVLFPKLCVYFPTLAFAASPPG